MTDTKQQKPASDAKTAQPFGDEVKDTSSPGVGRTPKVAADAVGDEKKQAESPKTTQRTE